MASEYDQETAAHYAAYRPPLHHTILKRGLRKEESFARALDIGCGTGRSTLALQEWSPAVLGTDPSAEMIAATSPQAGVTFAVQPGEDIAAGLPHHTFDLVCFAGSLFYLDAAAASNSLQQLLVPGGTVIVYDFDIQLAPVFDLLGVSVAAGAYDHAKNFSHLPQQSLQEVIVLQETIGFSATKEEIAHLLFSVQAWRTGPLEGFSFAALQAALPPEMHLEAAIFLTRYQQE